MRGFSSWTRTTEYGVSVARKLHTEKIAQLGLEGKERTRAIRTDGGGRQLAGLMDTTRRPLSTEYAGTAVRLSDRGPYPNTFT